MNQMQHDATCIVKAQLHEYKIINKLLTNSEIKNQLQNIKCLTFMKLKIEILIFHDITDQITYEYTKPRHCQINSNCVTKVTLKLFSNCSLLKI
jgi:hypothetical protein